MLDFLTERDLKGLFDGGVASCEVKVNKPDPRIYQALLDKYHLRADECIFIDDRADNLVAASALASASTRCTRRHPAAQPAHLRRQLH